MKRWRTLLASAAAMVSLTAGPMSASAQPTTSPVAKFALPWGFGSAMYEIIGSGPYVDSFWGQVFNGTVDVTFQVRVGVLQDDTDTWFKGQTSWMTLPPCARWQFQWVENNDVQPGPYALYVEVREGTSMEYSHAIWTVQ